MIDASCSVVLADVAFRFRYRKVYRFKSGLVHNVAGVEEAGADDRSPPPD
jgi:hypothetical protein